MRSTTRFLGGTLLGVALGVALGFLFFQKPARKVWEDLFPSSPESDSLQDIGIRPCFDDEAIEAQPWTVDASEYEAVAAVLVTESEVFVTPEVLEEPLPRAGWDPSTTTMAEEGALAEAATSAAANLDAYASIEVEPLDFESIPVWAEAPTAEPEVVPDVEAAAEEAAEEATEELEDIAAEPAAVVELPVEPEVEEIEVAEPEVEDVEVEAAPIPTPADDLKARIEETRRRIRRELEQPFIVGAGAAAAEAASPEFEPVIGEALAVGPVGEGEAGAEVEEPAASAPGDTEPSEAAAADEHPPVSADGPGVDYEAMRGRIEETRSRLKAKAFDAMMTGESALLGRDPGDAGVKLPAPTDVDGEIGETIDSTLREEEA
jgi:hypothetical protein